MGCFIAVKLGKTKILLIIYDIHKVVGKLAHVRITGGSLSWDKHFGFGYVWHLAW